MTPPSAGHLTAYDGTRLAYRRLGSGRALLCLAGGPMQDCACLGDLGGLSAHRQLILLDLRGTGASAVPADVESYRCDRQVDDVEAVREHLGLDRIDLLAHCAGANLAVLYAARYPDRIGRLALVTPSTRALGIEAASQQRRDIVALRADEPWFEPAAAAFEAIQSGHAGEADWAGITPFTYGRWDDAARANEASGVAQCHDEAAAAYGADGAYDPPATRAALAALEAPVLLIAGSVDVAAPPAVVTEFAAAFPNPTIVTQPGAGHWPWLDDPARFTATVAAFLG